MVLSVSQHGSRDMCLGPCSSHNDPTRQVLLLFPFCTDEKSEERRVSACLCAHTCMYLGQLDALAFGWELRPSPPMLPDSGSRLERETARPEPSAGTVCGTEVMCTETWELKNQQKLVGEKLSPVLSLRDPWDWKHWQGRKAERGCLYFREDRNWVTSTNTWYKWSWRQSFGEHARQGNFYGDDAQQPLGGEKEGGP